MKKEELESLARSIKERGLLQPIVVAEKDGKYVLVAGQRRLMAVEMLGWERVPARVVEVGGEEDFLKLALVENLLREDLDPVEEAEGFKSLVEGGMSHEEIAELVGKSRSYVSNALRLLSLPRSVLQLVREGRLSAGSARALVGLPSYEAERLAEEAVKRGLTVRDVEEMVKRTAEKRGSRAKSRPAKRPRRLLQEEREVRESLGFGKVEIRRKGKEVLVLFKFSEEEFEKFKNLF
jgi:ParB family chromosome partitioning protein